MDPSQRKTTPSQRQTQETVSRSRHLKPFKWFLNKEICAKFDLFFCFIFCFVKKTWLYGIYLRLFEKKVFWGFFWLNIWIFGTFEMAHLVIYGIVQRPILQYMQVMKWPILQYMEHFFNIRDNWNSHILGFSIYGNIWGIFSILPINWTLIYWDFPYMAQIYGPIYCSKTPFWRFFTVFWTPPKIYIWPYIQTIWLGKRLRVRGKLVLDDQI